MSYLPSIFVPHREKTIERCDGGVSVCEHPRPRLRWVWTLVLQPEGHNKQGPVLSEANECIFFSASSRLHVPWRGPVICDDEVALLPTPLHAVTLKASKLDSPRPSALHKDGKEDWRRKNGKRGAERLTSKSECHSATLAPCSQPGIPNQKHRKARARCLAVPTDA